MTSAESNVKSAQLSQQANLHPQTPEQIAQARANVDSAQVTVDSARRGVNETTLLAPQDGKVLSVANKVGEVASGGELVEPRAAPPAAAARTPRRTRRRRRRAPASS